MKEHADALEMIERIAAGDFAPDVLRRLREGTSAWLLAGGEVSLERCMRLPNTPKRMRQAQRNEWIRRAALMTGEHTSYAAAQKLEEELSRFLSRGPWLQLRAMPAPPPGLGRMSQALFHVARLNDGDSLSSKQIHRVIRRSFNEKCPSTTSIITATEAQCTNQH